MGKAEGKIPRYIEEWKTNYGSIWFSVIGFINFGRLKSLRQRHQLATEYVYSSQKEALFY